MTMTRQHKPNIASHQSGKSHKKLSFADDVKSTVGISWWKKALALVILAVAVGCAYMGYLETRVNSPFDDQKMVVKSGLDVPERYWGSYRPGVYFGLKTRDPHSLVAGLMWYFPRLLSPDGSNIRHWCELGDNLDRYTWVQHDGTNFGVQELEDGPFLFTTSYVKRLGGLHGGDWSARITVNTKKGGISNGQPKS